ncbi:unnamed protein product [Cyprideis torosa]|uniref:Uncharacterized protein n=1 Tax=Cyprideis torosa TaxID=163714 RepID=A0A7R8W8D1_9CRUS|nr:unnamed protein product [Cyprideis torosa]CAG0888476.1 unnamed protein product [Cyprideis torosa]
MLEEMQRFATPPPTPVDFETGPVPVWSRPPEFQFWICACVGPSPRGSKGAVLRLGNPRIQNIVKFPELEVFLHRVGWDRVYQEGEEILLFSLQNNLLQQAVSALGNCRVISPRASEWVPETKVIVRNPAVERDLNLRAEAAKVRDKEYKEALKELEEKKQIAQQIREEHRNDRYRRLVRSPQPASPLPKDLAAKNRSPPAHTTGRGY